MSLTGGSEAAFSQTTIDDILGRMKADLRAQVTAEHDGVLRAEREKVNEAEEQHRKAKLEFETAAAEAEAAKIAAIETARRLEREREAGQRKLETLAARAGVLARRIVTVVLASCVGLSLFLGATRPESLFAKIAWMAGPLLAIGALLAYLDNVHELSVKRLGSTFELWVRNRVRLGFSDGPPEDDSDPRGPTSL